MSADKLLPPLNELFPLDYDPGPTRFSTKQRQAMISGAIEAWQAERSANEAPQLRRRYGRVVAIAAATFALTGAAAALWYGIATTGGDEPAGTAIRDERSARGGEATGATDEPAATAEPAAGQTTAESRTARDLLQLANRMRREGRWNEAEQTYSEVFRNYPSSMSGYVARVAAASIRLDHLDDACGALWLYREAVANRPGGSLEAEARQGIARSWQRLGDTEREREALVDLLQKQASGPAAEQARHRLEAIAGER